MVSPNLLLTEMQRKGRTVMFDSIDDWNQEMKRTKGTCKLVTENQSFELFERYISISSVISSMSPTIISHTVYTSVEH